MFATPRMLSHFSRLVLIRTILLILLGMGGIPLFASAASPISTTLQSNKIFGPTQGLVGYWTFNGPDTNWTTGTVLDRSGQGNNGTMIGMATKTSPVIGKLGQGMRFFPSPTVDYVNAGSPAVLDNMSSMTTSFWIKIPSSISSGFVLQKSGTVSPVVNGWRVELLGGNVEFSVGHLNTTLSTFTASPLGINTWKHVVVTWDGGALKSGVNFYINGALAAKSVGGLDGNGARDDDSNSNFTVGGFAGQTTFYHFNGTLDDVRIYNRILSPTEIKQLYSAGQVVVNAAPKPKIVNNLVGWWTFDGPDTNWTTNTVRDRSGQGNNGTMIGMATKTSPVIGKLGQGILFNYPSQTQSVINVLATSSINNLTNKTIAAWIRSRSSGGGGGAGVVVSKSGWTLGYWGGVLQFHQLFSGATDGRWNFSLFAQNEWHHVVVTYDKSSTSNVPILYFDGIATTTNVSTSPTGASWNDSGSQLSIGNKTATRQFDGTLDDVRIYNRILTATEIAQLYKEGSATIAVFQCGTSTVKDADGNVYNTLKIGTQCWMKQNMRVGTRINVSTNQSNNGIIEKYCYNDTASNCTSNNPNQPDGGLYQWNEAMQYSTTPGARGICPKGWHIPTHDEWTTLERAVCTSGTCATDFPYDTTTTGYRGTNEGTKLKPSGTSGFEGNLAGYSGGGSFFNRGAGGVFWSSLSSGGSAWVRLLNSGVAQVGRSTYFKSNGLSVRCVKDS